MAGSVHAIAGFRLRVGTLLAVRHCLRLLFAWTMVWAALVVLLRVWMGADRGLLLWSLLGYVPAIGAAILLAIRGIPSSGALRAALDRHGDLGGLLMTDGERDAPRLPSS